MSKYLSLRHKAMVLRDIGGYDLERGEMNPAIMEEFIGAVSDADISPVMWEPFAGHGGKSRSQDFADEAGMRLLSFDLEPSDERVVQADSTKQGPECNVGGVLFHPPYFGSSRMTKDEADLSGIEDYNEYVKSLQKTADFAKVSLVSSGLVCAVGRDYRHSERRVRLDMLYIEMFSDGLSLEQVWLSEPDVVLIFRKAP